MQSKTPNFDQKIKAISDQVRPGKFQCTDTGVFFELNQQECDLYRDLQMPPSTLSPTARHRRVMINNASDELFISQSALSGKKIITNIPPELGIPVYDDDEWWSDQWDAIDYGQPHDPQRSFQEQLYQLRLRVPRCAKTQYSQSTNVNSDWTVEGYQLKNCYMTYGGLGNENVFYSAGAITSKDSAEMFLVNSCELCYDLMECTRCYHSAYLYNCIGCINCYFGFDLKHCENCFGCYNLRHKKYYFFNQPLTKEEYEAKMKEIDLGSRAVVEKYKKEFWAQKNQFIRICLENTGVENCFSNVLVNCKNCYNCLVTTMSQDSANVFYTTGVENCIDVFNSLHLQRSGFLFGAESADVKYCYAAFNSCYSEYCDFCFDLENCFGCVGLRHKKFCILNKQYTEEEYWSLLDQIKCSMLDRNEYNNFIPFEYAIFPYNLTAAQKYYPMTKETAVASGQKWYDIKIDPNAAGLSAEKLPDNIKDAIEDLAGQPLICSETKRIFTINKPELEFYKKLSIPLPITYYLVRRQKNFLKLRPLVLVKSHCANCHKEIDQQQDSEFTNGIRVICPECYEKIIYG